MPTFSLIPGFAKPISAPDRIPTWDTLAITGNLTIAATSLNRFVIDIYSLTAGNIPGNAANFSSSTNYSWVIATVTGITSGFTGDKFTVNDVNFTNTHSGTFAVAVSGQNLMLTYTAIPESSTWGAVFGLGCMVLIITRRRQSQRP